MRQIRGFARDERGAVAMIFGMAFVMLCMCIGLAIDTARLYGVSRKVQAALDAAALEGAKLMSDDSSAQSSVPQRSQNTFAVNLQSVSSNEAVLTNFRATPDLSNQTVNVEVDVRVPTVFARLGGVRDFTFRKVSSSGYSDVQLEVVLALDVTGSMNQVPAGDSRTRIQSLKIAAVELVNGLFEVATSDSNVRISVVPWASGVTPGPYRQAATGSSSGTECLVERAGSGSTDDSLPGSATWAQPMPASLASTFLCPNEPVAPLRGRNNKTQIIAKINNLTASGATAGHVGAAWAWYMISPNWASTHSTDAYRPAPPSRNVVKAVIVMTDGDFTASYVGGAIPDGSSSNAASYDMFQEICEGMRTQGIQVHTIAFDLPNTYAIDQLGQCASSGTAHTPNNSSELRDVFRQMVSQLQSLRLTR